jgi:SPP1 family phage portal protein
MDLKAVLEQSDIAKKIQQLQKGRSQDAADTKTIQNAIDIKGHDINNTALRSDKKVKVTKTKADGTTYEQDDYQKVTRTALDIQNLIVERAVAFLFGNEVKVKCEDENLLTAINRVNKDNLIDSFNRQVARTCFQTTEVAEYWYVKDADANDKYGFKSTKKLKCAIFSPLLGDQLYPFFDDYGDMVAFSRSFKLKDNDGKTINMFETWTNDNYYRWKQGTTWEVDKDIKYPPTIKKIPVVYATQPNVEWYKVQPLIDRLEKLLSNFGDTNDYFASPMLFIKNGELLSISAKDQTGKILQADGDAEAKYLAWSQLPEPIKLEAEMLLRFIFSLTQTPDISFESVKGLGTNISGETLKMLFLDAHLKVMNKQETFDSYLTRRYNIVKPMLKALSSSIDIDVDIECTITPFMLNSETTIVDNLAAMVSAGIISIETAIEINPYVVDKMQELERLQVQNNAALELDKQQNQDNPAPQKKPPKKKAKNTNQQ